MTDLSIIDPTQVRDLRPAAVGPHGLKVLPAEFYASTTPIERHMLGHHLAAYVLPTVELVEWLRAEVGSRSCLEIGSGNGVLAAAAGIRTTDSRIQELLEIRDHYARLGQPLITYPDSVERLTAVAAVEKYRPDVVVGAWVTHLYESSRPQAEGSVLGVDENYIVASCKTYILIGNEKVHEKKPIWALPHRRFTPPWLYSRASNGTPDFIAVWGEALSVDP